MVRFLKFLTVFILLNAAYTSCLADNATGLRIISLTPATTELLFELGLDEEIVGVSNYCSWPLQAKAKEKVGSFSAPNLEKIIMLKPDLVVLTGMEQEHIKGILSRLNIEYINVDPANLNELILSIKELGKVTCRESEARRLTEKISSAIAGLRRLTYDIPQKSKPKVYMEIWHDPIMCPGRDSFVNDMITVAGGINITSELKRAYSRIGPEQIILRDPDTIILTYMKPDDWVKDTFSKRLGWKDISAVRKGKVYADVNPDIILRPGPRVVEGLLELYKRFYYED